MYRLGHRTVHHYILFAAACLVAIGVVVASVVAVRSILQPHTTIKQAKSVTHTVTAGQLAAQTVSKSVFTMQLPADWRAVEAPHVRYTVYSWAGAGAFGAARRLDVYVDVLPLDLAVNHLLPVQASGNTLDVIGTVSDNCVNFTDRTKTSAATGQASSKWAGVNFRCDMGNYERDVVATGSAEGVNHTTLQNRAGRHQVLLVYTDNNASPDYTIFATIVKSFHLS